MVKKKLFKQIAENLKQNPNIRVQIGKGNKSLVSTYSDLSERRNNGQFGSKFKSTGRNQSENFSEAPADLSRKETLQKFINGSLNLMKEQQ